MFSNLARALVACGALAMTSVACGNASCLDLVKEYDQEKANALTCDPAASDPCSDQSPVVVKLVDADGGVTVEGLASNCNHAINPARSAKLHEILGRFQAMGCTAEPVPLCTGITDQCIQGASGPTCAP